MDDLISKWLIPIIIWFLNIFTICANVHWKWIVVDVNHLHFFRFFFFFFYLNIFLVEENLLGTKVSGGVMGACRACPQSPRHPGKKKTKKKKKSCRTAWGGGDPGLLLLLCVYLIAPPKYWITSRRLLTFLHNLIEENEIRRRIARKFVE